MVAVECRECVLAIEESCRINNDLAAERDEGTRHAQGDELGLEEIFKSPLHTHEPHVM